MLPVFKNPVFQEKFEREGFVKLKLFDSSQIKLLRDYYEDIRPQHEAAIRFRSLYSSVETGDTTLLKKLDNFVKSIVRSKVEATFQNYQLLISSYLVKESGDDTELMPHQDLRFVDESNHCSFNLWIPLQNTDSQSGQLRVLKGSHKLKKTLRVVPEYPRPFLPYQNIIRSLFTDIDTEIGECVVINHAVIHGSTVNLTGQPRLAVILGMCSAPAEVNYYYMPNADHTKIEKYKMTAEDYYSFKPDGRPLHAPLSAIISHDFDIATVQEFKGWVKNDPHLSFWDKLKLLYLTHYNATDPHEKTTH